ncbi:probable serine/threonine-protein kinase SIS8 isoform X1 [Triticum dicoccoides]|uniref:non-specific serine/threonine protein kinase n=1 Tax=Triticum aestivum TaxID=4565 RepID=A0A3B6SG94_WHEAT|nr:probable serine/threonine-protein kinase SIS8 isoform X1 [Triticum dicoccoides]XP_044430410.1 probable serine/threonine-protein kinase SIS8 isoform X1 [Triticum aestivum]
MKNFLRKLHIGDSAGDGASSPAPPLPSSKKGGGGGGGAGGHHASSGISSWLSSVAGRPHPPPPPLPAAAAVAETEAEELALASSIGERQAAEEETARRDERKEDRKREIEKQEKREDELEEYHMQLALEMSAREDPEAMQIEVAKQISLGSCPLQSSAAEVVAFRYWSFSALSYDDKVLDGFYDIWATGGKPALRTIPSLMELHQQPFSLGAKTEAVLVNRAQDSELVDLGQKALIMAVDFRSQTSHSVGRVLIQRLAVLVANHMGGPVVDPENVLLKYQNMSSSLRASIRSSVMPLGRLTIGLARHRALLFKVLADNLDVPCRLVKGRQYTGSDDGALNIVKLNDGREYIVDLMSDPGTLIASDGADLGREFEESSFADNHQGDKDEGNTQLGSSVSEPSSSVCGSFENESKGSTPTNVVDPYCVTTSQTRNQGSLQSSSLGELSAGSHASESLPIIKESRNADHTLAVKNKEKPTAANKSSSSSPSSSEVGSAPAVRRTKVKDVSEYMISAAKDNPQLAEKIHAVLLENGVVPPPDLFSEESREQPKDLIVYDTSLFQTKGEMIKRMNELESTSHDESDHGPSLPPHPGYEHQTKAVHYRPKPVQGMGIYHPSNFHDNSNPSLPLYESSALAREYPFQLIKQMPVTAAAVATAAVVASSMVVAAAKSNSDIKLDVPVAAAATAAAVVATSAAVKQYEYMDPGCQLISLPSSSEANGPVHRVRPDCWDKDQLEIDHGQENALEQGNALVEVPQEAERISDKSIGTESVRSDVTMDDVAEFEIQWEEIVLGERVGLGSFGEVYRGEWHGTEVAVKKFLQQDISSDILEELKAEVRIMKRLRHPNVVLFMGAVTRIPNLSILTEFLPRGSLFRLIRRPNNQLDERKRIRMALDVARGMNYLHNCTPVVVHRDLKSPNLLVDKNWVVKVCDFGLSRIKHNTFLSSRSTAGTAEWMAPEVLRNEPSDEKCDVFSYGVILWELCTLLQPWEGMNPMQVVGAVGFQERRLDIPAEVDPAIAEIIERCWQTDPKTRPSFSEIMAALKRVLKKLSANQPRRQRVQETDD